MRVVFIRGANVDVKRTCAFAMEALRARKRMIDKKALCRQIAELAEKGLIQVTAYDGQMLAGLLLLKTDGKDWEINPGVFGGHPLIAAGQDEARVYRFLLEGAEACAREHGASGIQLTAIRRPDECGERADHARYEDRGLSHVLSYVEMICSVRQNIPDALPLPEGYSFAPITTLPREELYPVYRAAFLQGEARFFFLQDEAEQRDYFETLGWEEACQIPVSHMVMANESPVAFSLVLPFSISSYHISCMCVHPAHQRRRLGEAMLVHILRSAAAADVPLISLGTEPEMRACCLYSKYGFEIRGGTSYYVKSFSMDPQPSG